MRATTPSHVSLPPWWLRRPRLYELATPKTITGESMSSGLAPEPVPSKHPSNLDPVCGSERLGLEAEDSG